MLKISEATSLALHTASLLAAHPDRQVSTKEIASLFQISGAHLSKVLQQLGRHGLVKSSRGPGGGFRLNKSAGEISLLDVYEAIDGPFQWQKCLLGHPACPIHRCLLGGLLESVNQQVWDYLSNTRLSQLAHDFRFDQFKPAP